MFRRASIATIVSACLLFAVKAALFPQPTALVVVAGQSNADGPASNAAEVDGGVGDPNVSFWWKTPGVASSDSWSHLSSQPGSFADGHFGPEVGIARYFGGNVSIFKFTKGATSLHRDWRPFDDDGLFQIFLREIDAALRLSVAPIRPACFIWVQGESDAETATMSDGYRDRLEYVISQTRAALNAPDLPVVLSVDEQHRWVLANPAVVNIQQAIAAKDPDAAWVSMGGLPKADTTHLTAAGTLVQGERLAEACQALSG